MGKSRLEAFSDGVMAIIITIMVLELKAPHGADFETIKPLIPIALSYLLSFIYVGIYWNNHHHMFQATQKIGGAVLWANLHLLFWLSLFPFVTDWMGQNHFAPVPTAFYGCVLFMAAVAYWILQKVIMRQQGDHSLLARAVGKDIKGKISPVIYAVAVVLAFLSHEFLAGTLYVLVALMWLIPDRRIERVITAKESKQEQH